MIVKAVVIEDEPLAANFLVSLIQKLDPQIKVETVIDNVKSAVKFLKNNPVDLIFLDIHLGDADAFSIFKEVQPTGSIIFTTAYNEYAIRAFKLNSVDYLLKPIEEDDLAYALDKFYKSRNQQTTLPLESLLQAYLQPQNQFRQRFMLNSATRIVSVTVDQVAYIKSEGRYTKFILNDGKSFLHNESMESLEQELNPANFFRVNRQYLVNYDSIKEMIPWSKSRIKLVLQPIPEEDVVVSVERSPQFKTWLDR